MDHQHIHSRNIRPLVITLAFVLVVMVAEIVGGFLSNSLALIGDAGHMFTDALALVLSMAAIAIARRPATPKKTYGYHRAEIMAALINGAILIIISGFIFYEAYKRFTDPPEVKTGLMLLIAVIGLVTNLAGILILRKSSRSSLNIRAAFWHIIGDTMSSVGVIIAGVTIMITGWYIVDPILSVIIGIIILWGAVRIVKESVDILLESVPGHIDIDKVTDAVKAVPGVEGIHDIHIWTITSGMYALSAHLQITDQMVSGSTEVISAVNRVLEEGFDISHTTLQLECEECSSDLLCSLNDVK